MSIVLFLLNPHAWYSTRGNRKTSHWPFCQQDMHRYSQRPYRILNLIANLLWGQERWEFHALWNVGRSLVGGMITEVWITAEKPFIHQKTMSELNDIYKKAEWEETDGQFHHDGIDLTISFSVSHCLTTKMKVIHALHVFISQTICRKIKLPLKKIAQCMYVCIVFFIYDFGTVISVFHLRS
jgi:hypothetical protein